MKHKLGSGPAFINNMCKVLAHDWLAFSLLSWCDEMHAPLQDPMNISSVAGLDEVLLAHHQKLLALFIAEPFAETVLAGSVAALHSLGFDGVKLDACSQFNNLTQWNAMINASGRATLVENCHQCW